MKTIFNFIVKSSADPKATSLTVRAFLVGLIPITIKILGLACGFGVTCLPVDTSMLQAIVEGVTNAVYFLLAAGSAVFFVYGLFRKIYLTYKGRNQAIQ